MLNSKRKLKDVLQFFTGGNTKEGGHIIGLTGGNTKVFDILKEGTSRINRIIHENELTVVWEEELGICHY